MAASRMVLGAVVVAAWTAGLETGPARAQEELGTAGFATLAEGVTGRVISLRRLPHDGLVQLDYRLENAGSTPVALEALGLTSNGCIDNFRLIDFPGEKMYLVGGGSGFCLSSTTQDAVAIEPDGSFEGWAWFRPPETVVGPVWIRMGDAFPIFDVPLQ